jgi:isopentenyl diphosphate isomerase/L-lactate dehydrogenase-like FMN-dependent dehydrogenase
MPEVSSEPRFQDAFWPGVDADSERGATARANRDAFDAAGVYPRNGVVREGRDLVVTVFGTEVHLPALLGPVETVRIVHPGGPARGSAQRMGTCKEKP